ncbi:MAG: hypothetical protein U0528_08910 [Anaerolineae bacterium]
MLLKFLRLAVLLLLLLTLSLGSLALAHRGAAEDGYYCLQMRSGDGRRTIMDIRNGDWTRVNTNRHRVQPVVVEAVSPDGAFTARITDSPPPTHSQATLWLEGKDVNSAELLSLPLYVEQMQWFSDHDLFFATETPQAVVFGSLYITDDGQPATALYSLKREHVRFWDWQFGTPVIITTEIAYVFNLQAHAWQELALPDWVVQSPPPRLIRDQQNDLLTLRYERGDESVLLLLDPQLGWRGTLHYAGATATIDLYWSPFGHYVTVVTSTGSSDTLDVWDVRTDQPQVLEQIVLANGNFSQWLWLSDERRAIYASTYYEPPNTYRTVVRSHRLGGEASADSLLIQGLDRAGAQIRPHTMFVTFQSGQSYDLVSIDDTGEMRTLITGTPERPFFTGIAGYSTFTYQAANGARKRLLLIEESSQRIADLEIELPPSTKDEYSRTFHEGVIFLRNLADIAPNFAVSFASFQPLTLADPGQQITNISSGFPSRYFYVEWTTQTMDGINIFAPDGTRISAFYWRKGTPLTDIAPSPDQRHWLYKNRNSNELYSAAEVTSDGNSDPLTPLFTLTDKSHLLYQSAWSPDSTQFAVPIYGAGRWERVVIFTADGQITADYPLHGIWIVQPWTQCR